MESKNICQKILIETDFYQIYNELIMDLMSLLMSMFSTFNTIRGHTQTT